MAGEMKSLLYARRNPYPLMLWLAIAGSGIIFLFISLVFFSRFGTGHTANLPLPYFFYLSTPLLVASSFSLAAANRQFKIEQYTRHRLLLLLTLILGLLFTLSQIAGWMQMFNQGFYLDSGSMGGAFIYLITGLHGLHVLGGVGALMWLVWNSFINSTYVANYLNGMNPFHKARVQLLTIYWHFVDVLWLFLMLLITLMH